MVWNSPRHLHRRWYGEFNGAWVVRVIIVGETVNCVFGHHREVALIGGEKDISYRLYVTDRTCICEGGYAGFLPFFDNCNLPVAGPGYWSCVIVDRLHLVLSAVVSSKKAPPHFL